MWVTDLGGGGHVRDLCFHYVFRMCFRPGTLLYTSNIDKNSAPKRVEGPLHSRIALLWCEHQAEICLLFVFFAVTDNLTVKIGFDS